MINTCIGRTWVAAYACTAVAGCFSHPTRYPERWPVQAVVADGTCPEIDGTYLNAGESIQDEFGTLVSTPRSLAHVLNGGSGLDSLELWNKLGETSADPAQDRNRTIRLALGPGGLQVYATAADGAARSLLQPVQAQCRDSVRLVDANWGSFAKLPGSYDAVGRISLALGRSEDGSLLVRETESGVYVYPILPAFGYRSQAWLRFEEAKAADATVGAAP